MVLIVFLGCLNFQIQDGCPKWPPKPFWKPKSGISWYRWDKNSNKVSFTIISGIKNVTEWFLIFSETILTFKLKSSAQKWPLIPYIYMKSKKSWIKWVTEMDKVFPDNPDSTNLIELYLLYFWIVLTIKFMMTGQNGGQNFEKLKKRNMFWTRWTKQRMKC